MTADNRFVFVVPMYNASATLDQCLASVVAQSYRNWRVVLVDDVSDQHEVVKEAEAITRWRRHCQPGMRDDNCDAQVRVFWNDQKLWEVANVLRGIELCADDDIVCRLDADDWLTDIDGLAYLNALYQQTGAEALWTAHRWAYTDKNISGPLLPDVSVYQQPWVSSHLKTFRKRLLNGVNDLNFRGEDGQYVRRAGDQAIYLPVLHRATRKGFVPRVMYHYTIKDEPATYQTADARFQRDEALFLRARGFIE